MLLFVYILNSTCGSGFRYDFKNASTRALVTDWLAGMSFDNQSGNESAISTDATSTQTQMSLAGRNDTDKDMVSKIAEQTEGSKSNEGLTSSMESTSRIAQKPDWDYWYRTIKGALTGNRKPQSKEPEEQGIEMTEIQRRDSNEETRGQMPSRGPGHREDEVVHQTSDMEISSPGSKHHAGGIPDTPKGQLEQLKEQAEKALAAGPATSQEREQLELLLQSVQAELQQIDVQAGQHEPQSANSDPVQTSGAERDSRPQLTPTDVHMLPEAQQASGKHETHSGRSELQSTPKRRTPKPVQTLGADRDRRPQQTLQGTSEQHHHEHLQSQHHVVPRSQAASEKYTWTDVGIKGLAKINQAERELLGNPTAGQEVPTWAIERMPAETWQQVRRYGWVEKQATSHVVPQSQTQHHVVPQSQTQHHVVPQSQES